MAQKNIARRVNITSVVLEETSTRIFVSGKRRDEFSWISRKLLLLFLLLERLSLSSAFVNLLGYDTCFMHFSTNGSECMMVANWMDLRTYACCCFGGTWYKQSQLNTNAFVMCPVIISSNSQIDEQILTKTMFLFIRNLNYVYSCIFTYPPVKHSNKSALFLCASTQ